VKPIRYFLLVSLLVTALAAQGLFAQAVYAGGGMAGGGSRGGLPDLIQLVGGARAFVRRLNREEQKPARCLRALSARLTLRRLRLMVARLLDQMAPPVEFVPFLFRLPPPAMRVVMA
jgi:hypothetical protein